MSPLVMIPNQILGNGLLDLVQEPQKLLVPMVRSGHGDHIASSHLQIGNRLLVPRRISSWLKLSTYFKSLDALIIGWCRRPLQA